MSNSISSLQKEINNLNDNRCQLLDENGKVLAEFDGKMQEICGQIFVILNNKIYDIVFDDGEYRLQENSGIIN